ncbi:nicotinate phosphoribosyltransferase-like isoform X2 [Varroa destructor]|uniref:Nicotinate phosphoribosyltransferase n=1 Tax=Varroa destructor TaxID=109461 RepID=A0A7M7JHA4_VARDE|nr:nicotinate phosphoribosyltransferase-like isoform X2 [Varroa destructor]
MSAAGGVPKAKEVMSLCDYDYTMSGLDGVAQPLLTDMYQLSMAYAYWCSGKHSKPAVFELFFRSNPFQGEFTVFAGLADCVEFLKKFRYSVSDLDYLRKEMPTVKNEFFDYLAQLTAKDVKLYSVQEGSVVFPRIPLLRIEGPLALVQLLETTLLNLVNYASLVATNAARFRLAAGSKTRLLEFGLRRAQGPNGGLSASKYAYVGGFDGTSNVMAGKLFKIPVRGTHAHAFVMSFNLEDEIENPTLPHAITGEQKNLLELSLNWRKELCESQIFQLSQSNDAELYAFISYALAFPKSFLGLVDTYDVVRSGLINFCSVALALDEMGYRAVGIRLDSGDLAYLSREAHMIFQKISERYDRPYFVDLTIVASNDINEETIISLNEQGHNINCFGIGTHLVTCQKQPALGCVYKLVEIDAQPCIKLSNDLQKVTIPGRKKAFRLYGRDGHPLLDLLQLIDEDAPMPGEKVLCRHPFISTKRAFVCPHKVESLYQLYWSDGAEQSPLPELEIVRQRVMSQMHSLRADIKRTLNPTPYKVSVTEKLYTFMHELWLKNAPIGELS